MSPEMIAAVLGLLATVALTALVRRYALAAQLMDVPNARSSHSASTPRGGGLAIVVVFLAGLVLAALWDHALAPLATALLPAAAAVALIGLWDDHADVSARARILVHTAAVVWAMAWLGGELALPLPGGLEAGGWLTLGLAGVAMVWFVNLFNFMDGIDGIAGSEAAFLGLAGAAVVEVAGAALLALPFTLLAAAAAGFLVWNWPPARIFMGDVGSGFLGLALGVLFYAAALAEPATLWAWVILPAAFVTDATLTLVRRFLRGERWYRPHRSHAYQWASRRWGHRSVTLGLVIVDLVWLLPWALVAVAHPAYGVAAAAAAYLPLVPLALRLGAGRAERPTARPAA